MSGKSEIESAADLVRGHMTPTPQIRWPQLDRRAGCEVWVKHENHAPTGSFKVRGGLVYVDDRTRSCSSSAGLIAATRGNHGQSLAFAAACRGVSATVVVPHGNSLEKNAAMRAYGAELIEHGSDFQQALEHSRRLAEERGLQMVESFHPLLVRGVATYAFELLTAVRDLDAVYVPIGLGSGICGMIAARDALGLRTDVVGVVAQEAPAYALSFAERMPVSTESSNTFADGIATRVPVPEAVEAINAGAARLVTVSELEIASAIRAYHTDTHNLAEGAGAAAFAALVKDRARMAGRKVAVVLSGGNIDGAVYRQVLAGRVPSTACGDPGMRE